MLDVVVTGARVRALAALLGRVGWVPVAAPRVPVVGDLPAGCVERVRGLYEVLGGDPCQFERARPGGWDLAFGGDEGPLLVELDEEQHFNRYRGWTVEATRDLGLPWGSAYARFCVEHEAGLLPGWGSGKRWASPSADRFFGASSPPGDFTGVGAARWRQRAFYDSVKDVLTGRRLARISVYDLVAAGWTLEDVLRGRVDGDGVAGAVAELVARRVHVT